MMVKTGSGRSGGCGVVRIGRGAGMDGQGVDVAVHQRPQGGINLAVPGQRGQAGKGAADDADLEMATAVAGTGVAAETMTSTSSTAIPASASAFSAAAIHSACTRSGRSPKPLRLARPVPSSSACTAP